MITHKIINSCQISGSKKLYKVVNLGFLPPVNQLFKTNSKINKQNFFHTELLYCHVSKLVQINVIVDKKIVFPKSYPYTSSTTKILRENFNQLYKEVKKILLLKKKKFIVDIGSNDGNLLSNFKDDFKVLGVTPEDIGKIAINKGIPTILKYFNKEVATLIKKKHGKPNVITATNVFAHIDNPRKLLREILSLLDKDGVFITESHYLLPFLKKVQYDTIYHEHLRYYSLESLKYFFSKYNLKIFHAKKIPTHGGSIRVYATKNKKYKINKSVKKILNEEKNYININNLKNFKKSIVNSKLKLLKILSEIKNKNKKIYGISAPSRASTLINYVGIDENIIDCVLEIDGSKKINKMIPGTKIPILNEKILYKDKPDFVIIFSWHIFNEIKTNLRKKGYRGKFIVPLPTPKIIN
ncbi:class I SAM-dependent methyltransferase [Candidatus Pelagibacter sp.]|nr:class I SAM-dependent methyltransferase [Candidatus Pelagibacter sp.]